MRLNTGFATNFVAECYFYDKSRRMDRMDVKILSYLQENGRASYQEIGEAVGLSFSACHKRVKALRAGGVIERYAAIISEEEAGYPISAYVRVTLKEQSKASLDAFEKAVARNPEIAECVLMSGDSDYFLRVLCSGIKDFDRIHREFLTSLPGVDSVRTSFALRTVFRRNTVPIRL